MVNWLISKISNFFQYTKKLSKKSTNQKSNITGSIIFDIIDNKDIVIKCYFPEIDELDEDSFLHNAESYARMLSNITDGVYSQKIADILIKSSDKDDPQTVLFVNNIISFWSAFHTENFKMDLKNSNQPMIRPSKVFKR
jgi:hypothetical protein